MTLLLFTLMACNLNNEVTPANQSPDDEDSSARAVTGLATRAARLQPAVGCVETSTISRWLTTAASPERAPPAIGDAKTRLTGRVSLSS
jgi:hypothetical protein